MQTRKILRLYGKHTDTIRQNTFNIDETYQRFIDYKKIFEYPIFSMIAILSHALEHFTIQIFSRILSPPTENADSTKSIRAFGSFPFMFARRGIASFTTSRQPVVSIILTRLADFVVKRMCLP